MPLPFLSSKSTNYDALDALNQVNVSEAIHYSNADKWIVFRTLQSKEDIDGIVRELKSGNIVIFETAGPKSNNANLVEWVDLLKTETYKIDGDIAKIAETKMIASPRRIKIRRK